MIEFKDIIFNFYLKEIYLSFCEKNINIKSVITTSWFINIVKTNVTETMLKSFKTVKKLYLLP